MTINSKEEKKIKIVSNIENKKINLKSIHNERLKIFLIGSTSSYLGSYLLYNLIKLFSVENVYCLIENSKTTSEAMEEIKDNLKQFNLYSTISEDNFIKIIPVIGNLNKENFNLSILQYNHLIHSTNLILNSLLYDNIKEEQKIFNSEDSQKEIESNNNDKDENNDEEDNDEQYKNIKEIIKFSKNGIIKRIVYLSNIYNIKDNIENQLKIASKNEIPCQIIRITNYLIPISNFNNKKNNNNNNNNNSQLYLNDFDLLIKLCKILNYYPSGCKKIKLLQSPINWVINNIINLIFNDKCWCQTNNLNVNILNLIAEQTISLKEYFKIMEQDFGIKKLNINEWKFKLNQLNNLNDEIKYKFTNNFDQLKLSINKTLPNCKNLLCEMNSYYGWKINNQLIKFYLNNLNNIIL